MTVNLLGNEINIEIYKKKSLRRVHFEYLNGCLKVTTPYFYSVDRTLRLLKENEKRIVRYINEKKNNQLKDNSLIKILGIQYNLSFSDINKIEGNIIYLKEPYNANLAKLLYEQMKDYMNKRTQYFYNLMYKDNNCPTISFKNVKTYRGQYNKKYHLITYNVSLALCDKDCIDYVIVHELAHIKEMNHQDKFYKIIVRYLPNYKYLRNKIKKEWINLC